MRIVKILSVLAVLLVLGTVAVAEGGQVLLNTWLLIPAKFTDIAKRDVIKDFLKWMMTDGQQYCEALSYAKLPKEVVAKEMKTIANIE